MPRLTKSLPKYRLKNVRGKKTAVVTLNGYDHYLGPFGSRSSKTEYDRLIGEWLAGGRRLPQDIEDVSISEICVNYMRHSQGASYIVLGSFFKFRQ